MAELLLETLVDYKFAHTRYRLTFNYNCQLYGADECFTDEVLAKLDQSEISKILDSMFFKLLTYIPLPKEGNLELQSQWHQMKNNFLDGKCVLISHEFSFGWETQGDKVSSSGEELQEESFKLPAIDTLVSMPCACRSAGGIHYKSSIHRTIIHLNDSCRWSRERIADWLDELHDSGEVDLTFKVDIDD